MDSKLQILKWFSNDLVGKNFLKICRNIIGNTIEKQKPAIIPARLLLIISIMLKIIIQINIKVKNV